MDSNFPRTLTGEGSTISKLILISPAVHWENKSPICQSRRVPYYYKKKLVFHTFNKLTNPLKNLCSLMLAIEIAITNVFKSMSYSGASSKIIQKVRWDRNSTETVHRFYHLLIYCVNSNRGRGYSGSLMRERIALGIVVGKRLIKKSGDNWGRVPSLNVGVSSVLSS